MPASAASATARAQRVERVLHDAGHRRDRHAARSRPRARTCGSTSSAGCSRVSATRRRIAGVARSRRGRSFGNSCGCLRVARARRRRGRAVRRRPGAATSSAGVVRVVGTARASSSATRCRRRGRPAPVSNSSPSSISACAPIGAEHPASSRREHPALGVGGDAGRAVVERARRAPRSPARTSIASAPCPGAVGQRVDVEELGDRVEPRRGARGRPPRARRRRDSPSRDTRARRVSTLPRMSTTSRSGRRASSCARRRGEPVPTRAPGASLSRVTPSRGAERVARVRALRARRRSRGRGAARSAGL